MTFGSLLNSPSLLATMRAMPACGRMSDSYENTPFDASSFSACPRSTRAPVPCKLLHGALHCPRVELLDVTHRREVRVVNDNVGVRDAALVVTVIDDHHFVVAKVLLGPHDREPAQARELDTVPRVRRENIVRPRPRAVLVPGGFVPEGGARAVHLAPPADAAVALEVSRRNAQQTLRPRRFGRCRARRSRQYG